MSWWARFTMFFLAAALSCVTAIAFLAHQNARGMPLSFTANMTLAALLALAAPLVAVIAFARLRREAHGAARFGVWYGVCVLATAVLALLTF